MSNNNSVLLVGAGNMAGEYYKVLMAQGYDAIVVGRGEESAAKFEKQFGCKVIRGGIENAKDKINDIPSKAIIASEFLDLKDSCLAVINMGIKSILLEKPGGVNREEIEEICNRAKEVNAEVYVAYNRRFYASTEKALQIIEEDGGVRSFHFEFTEWGNVIGKVLLERTETHRRTLLFGNSSHVIDLAFFLGGEPVELSTYSIGDKTVSWNLSNTIYSGAGITDKGALFSYQADWNAPGRWSVEILTHFHRLYFKPMEKLQIQELNSVKVEGYPIDDKLDIEFKPGLYRQVDSFLNDKDDSKKLSIFNQLEHVDFYEKIEGNL